MLRPLRVCDLCYLISDLRLLTNKSGRRHHYHHPIQGLGIDYNCCDLTALLWRPGSLLLYTVTAFCQTLSPGFLFKLFAFCSILCYIFRLCIHKLSITTFWYQHSSYYLLQYTKLSSLPSTIIIVAVVLHILHTTE